MKASYRDLIVDKDNKCKKCFKTGNLHQNPLFIISLAYGAGDSYPTDRYVALNTIYDTFLKLIYIVVNYIDEAFLVPYIDFI